jgi:hypothetical protein
VDKSVVAQHALNLQSDSVLLLLSRTYENHIRWCRNRAEGLELVSNIHLLTRLQLLPGGSPDGERQLDTHYDETL